MEYYKEYHKEYYKKNKERIRKQNKQWIINNFEKVKKQRKNNSERLKEYAKRYRKDNPGKAREWAINNPDKMKENDKRYKKNNKEKINKRENRRRKNKRKTDIHFRIKCAISGSINSRLKRRLFSKNGKPTFTFLPYTVDELKIHLENQFAEWMNWDNWGRGIGKWSIDHIKPDSSFNYKNVEDKEFQKCWALNNLQPLDAIENIKKSNKIQ